MPCCNDKQPSLAPSEVDELHGGHEVLAELLEHAQADVRWWRAIAHALARELGATRPLTELDQVELATTLQAGA